MRRLPEIRHRVRDARRGYRRRGPWTHARSYVGLSPSAFVHRARLARVRSLLRRLDLPREGLLIDLGCSDGYIVSELQRDGDLPASWCIAGYDASRRLVRRARRRAVPGAEFHQLDLNDATARVVAPGDLVLCLETLEHVGDYRAALQVVLAAMRPGARLVLSMPNEVGLVGLVKLVGRPVLRSRPYRTFFTGGRHRVHYTVAVLTRRELESFRTPPREAWGPHLGFDHRAVMRHIHREFVATGRCAIEHATFSAMGGNRFLILRREVGPEPRVAASPATPRPAEESARGGS